MCGIVGYVGNNKATKFLIEGLSKLEYRGYDSAGVAVIQDGNVEIVKQKGRLANLGDALNANPLEGTIGIGHVQLMVSQVMLTHIHIKLQREI